jgi:hypothetical protein
MSTRKAEIESYLDKNNVNKLRLACLKRFGLADSGLRRRIWPILLKVNERKNFLAKWKKSIKPSTYHEIIEKDVNRSLFGLDVTENFSEDERREKREQLSNIINAVINKNPNLHYFQGFNSICTVFLLVGGENLGFKMSYQCAELFIKDSMRKTFDEGVTIEMNLIYKLLERVDKRLNQKLQKIYTVETDVNSPMFSLSWVLTWLSHNIHCFEKLCRVFDFCLASHPLAPVYLAASIIYKQKDEIMSCNEMPEIHQHFHDLSKVDMEEVCEMSIRLMRQFEPMKLVGCSLRKFPSE